MSGVGKEVDKVVKGTTKALGLSGQVPEVDEAQQAEARRLRTQAADEESRLKRARIAESDALRRRRRGRTSLLGTAGGETGATRSLLGGR